jgi:hypothetical protein
MSPPLPQRTRPLNRQRASSISSMPQTGSWPPVPLLVPMLTSPRTWRITLTRPSHSSTSCRTSHHQGSRVPATSFSRYSTGEFCGVPAREIAFSRTLMFYAAFACRGSWILSASCPLVPALFLLLCARFLPAMSFWLGRLLLMRPCLLVNVCLLLVWCTVGCALSRCRPLPVLPGVAHPPSAPSGVPRPKPLWGKAWAPICFFF